MLLHDFLHRISGWVGYDLFAVCTGHCTKASVGYLTWDELNRIDVMQGTFHI